MTDPRFAFGKNWTDYVRRHMTPAAVATAKQGLLDLVRLPELTGLRVLDIGSGSGIHSLAAHLAGALSVTSFDYDEDSVSIARTVHAQHGAPSTWTIQQGSVLDADFMCSLGQFDLVYAWGVLHHTGDMMRALHNAAQAVAPNGLLALALYSYTAYQNNTVFGQPAPEEWLVIKQSYVEGNDQVKRRLIFQYIWRRYFARAGGNPLRLVGCAQEFFSRWYSYRTNSRGMNFFTDIKDWVGGWPMEFIKEDECFAFADREGLELLSFLTGRGNTEFLFRPVNARNHWDALLAARSVTPLQGPFKQLSAHVWQAAVPESLVHDTRQTPQASLVRLLEDTRPLIFPHCHREALEAFGGGRYHHEEPGKMLFSTSDNSDPNLNGRNYTWYADGVL